jgi:hypothetical protein
MKIPSDEIPQADVIEDVIKTVICIAKGGETFQDIAKAIGKVERQGRYYRKAAEIVGFVATPTRNHSVLTPLGKQLVKSNPTLTNPLFLQGVLSARIFQRIIPFLELYKTDGVTREEIVDFIISVADISGDSTAPRRFSSVVSWLDTLRIIEKKNESYFLSTTLINKKIPLLQFTEIDEPILPRSSNLNEYKTVEMRTAKAHDTIISYRDLAATERADNAHRKLVNLVATRVKATGAIPRYNQLIDLATRHQDDDYIFEMKSLTETNVKSQVRNGLSQLFEYRYLQNLPDAKLILVVETPLPSKTKWMVDYMEEDRDVLLVWDGDDQLYGTNETREKLAFLNLQP